ncbi:hypothetical protein LZ30DRAFT_783256 [Colletotrichum cereale]|nr:hypothetical protein LZ30DRAFT_783256 [Colletotrichum cereale]
MSSQESPAFAIDTKPDTRPQTTTAWGSYYRGSQEQLVGISRATFLRCHKRQQVREYDHRRAVEASWARLLQPVTGSRSERGEGRHTAVRFADVVEYIAHTPIETKERPCDLFGAGLQKPAGD